MHIDTKKMESDDEIQVFMPETFEKNLNIEGDITEELQILVRERRICKLQLVTSMYGMGHKHSSVTRHVANQIRKSTRILANLLKWLDFTDVNISVTAQNLCEAFSYEMPSLTVLVLNEHFKYSKELICKIAYNCPNLRHISLPNCDVAYDDVLLYFARKMQNLKVLRLDNPKPLTDDGFRNLCTHLVNLVILDVTRSSITDAGIEYIGNLKHLRELYLMCCDNITANCINVLSHCGSRLQELNILSCGGINPNEALHTIGLSGLPLTKISLGFSDYIITNHKYHDTDYSLTDEGITSFLAGEGGKDLVDIYLHYGRGDVSIDALSQLFFKCKKLEWIAHKVTGDEKN